MDTATVSLLPNGAPHCSLCVLGSLLHWWTCLVTLAAHQHTKVSFPPPRLAPTHKRGRLPQHQPLKVCYSGINCSKNKLTFKYATVNDMYDSSADCKCDQTYRKSTYAPAEYRKSANRTAAYTDLISKLLEPQTTFERMVRPTTNFQVYYAPMSPRFSSRYVINTRYANRRLPFLRMAREMTPEAVEPPSTSESVDTPSTSGTVNLPSTSTQVVVLAPPEPDWPTELVVSVTDFVLEDVPPIPKSTDPPTSSVVASPLIYTQANLPTPYRFAVPYTSEPMNRQVIPTSVEYTVIRSVVPSTCEWVNRPFTSARADRPSTVEQVNRSLVHTPLPPGPNSELINLYNISFSPLYRLASATAPQRPKHSNRVDQPLRPEPLDWFSNYYRMEFPQPPAPLQPLASFVPPRVLTPGLVNPQFSLGNCPTSQVMNFQSTSELDSQSANMLSNLASKSTLMDEQLQPTPLEWLSPPTPLEHVASGTSADNRRFNRMVDWIAICDKTECERMLNSLPADRPRTSGFVRRPFLLENRQTSEPCYLPPTAALLQWASVDIFTNVPLANILQNLSSSSQQKIIFSPEICPTSQVMTSQSTSALLDSPPANTVSNLASSLTPMDVQLQPTPFEWLSTSDTMVFPLESLESDEPTDSPLTSESVDCQFSLENPPTSQVMTSQSTSALLDSPPSNTVCNLASSSTPMNVQLQPTPLEWLSTSDTIDLPLEPLESDEPADSPLTSESLDCQFSLESCPTSDLQSKPALFSCPSSNELPNPSPTSNLENLQLSTQLADSLSTPNTTECPKSPVPIESLVSAIPEDGASISESAEQQQTFAPGTGPTSKAMDSQSPSDNVSTNPPPSTLHPGLVDCLSIGDMMNFPETSALVEHLMNSTSSEDLSTAKRSPRPKIKLEEYPSPKSLLIPPLSTASEIALLESAYTFLYSLSASKRVNAQSNSVPENNLSDDVFINPSLTSEPTTCRSPSPPRDLSDSSDSEDNPPSITECVSNELEVNPTSTLDIEDSPADAIEDDQPSTSEPVNRNMDNRYVNISALENCLSSAPETIDNVSTHARDDRPPSTSVPVDPPLEAPTSTSDDSPPSNSETAAPAAPKDYSSYSAVSNAASSRAQQTYVFVDNLTPSEIRAHPPRPLTSELFMFLELDLPKPSLALVSLAKIKKLSFRSHSPSPSIVCRTSAPQTIEPLRRLTANTSSSSSCSEGNNPTVINSTDASECQHGLEQSPHPNNVPITSIYPNTMNYSNTCSYSTAKPVSSSFETPIHCSTSISRNTSNFTRQCTHSPSCMYAADNRGINTLESGSVAAVPLPRRTVYYRNSDQYTLGNNYSRETSNSRRTFTPRIRFENPSRFPSHKRYSNRGSNSPRNRFANPGTHSPGSRHVSPDTFSSRNRYTNRDTELMPNSRNATPRPNLPSERYNNRGEYSLNNRFTNSETPSYSTRYYNRGSYSPPKKHPNSKDANSGTNTFRTKYYNRRTCSPNIGNATSESYSSSTVYYNRDTSSSRIQYNNRDTYSSTGTITTPDSANISYVNSANIGYVNSANIGYVNSPNISYVNSPNISYVDSANISYINSPSMSYVNSTNISYVHSPSVSYVHSPSVSYVNSPNISFVTSPSISYVDSPHYNYNIQNVYFPRNMYYNRGTYPARDSSGRWWYPTYDGSQYRTE